MRPVTSPIQNEVGIIVNADDLGASEAINEAIFAGIADGVITSSTIMANGPAVDSALRRLKEFPQASFGVHMNLTEFRPFTRSPDLAPLLDSAGNFRRNDVDPVHWTHRTCDAVAREWAAQVDHLRNAGARISHLDSHHHVHTIPRLFLALKRVQRITGVRRVRGTFTIFDREDRPSHKRLLSKRLWWHALRSYPIRARTTDDFTDFMVFRRALAEHRYGPKRGTRNIELMVHPGGVDADGAALEHGALRDGWMHNLPFRGKLIGYDQL